MNDSVWLYIGVAVAGGLVAFALRAVLNRENHGPSHHRISRQSRSVDPSSSSSTEWAILDRIAEGLVVVNDLLRPVVANEAARALLGWPDGALPSRLHSDEVLSVAGRAFEHDAPVEELVSTWFPASKTLRVRAELLELGGAVVLIEDITEELETQRLRREFVAHASHELKSPVASMQTLAEALEQAVRDDPATASRFAERIVTESERLSRLVADLLDLSRLEDPKKISNERVDFSSGVRRVLQDAELEAQSKEVAFKTEIQDGVFVEGDEAQMAVLVRNLVENAVRYTPEGGRVSVEVFEEDGAAVLRVSDNGIGIPLEAQARVFERFYRVDRARSRDRGGTGLGLAIVKHVAEIHGGTVSLESELGRGSIFTARIPAASPPPQRIASAG
ncbi:MAG: sensor histidine kinase [Actinomycetota bacterium]